MNEKNRKEIEKRRREEEGKESSYVFSAEVESDAEDAVRLPLLPEISNRPVVLWSKERKEKKRVLE